jgi:hypothetical protein
MVRRRFPRGEMRLTMSEKRPNSVIYAAALMIVVVLVIAVLLYYYAPGSPTGSDMHEIDYAAEQNVTLEASAESMNILIDMDQGALDIRFAELDGNALELNVTMEGEATTSDPGRILQWTLVQDQDGPNATVEFDLRVNQTVLTSGLKVSCLFIIDPKYAIGLDVKDKVGDIEMNGITTLRLEGLSIESDAGTIHLDLMEGTTLSSNVHVRGLLGEVRVNWDDVVLGAGPHEVEVTTATGSIVLLVSQAHGFQGQVNWTVGTNLGNVDASFYTTGRISSNITAEVGTGLLNSASLVGYDTNRTENRIAATSYNYPDEGNFEARIDVNVGNIVLVANYV